MEIRNNYNQPPPSYEESMVHGREPSSYEVKNQMQSTNGTFAIDCEESAQVNSKEFSVLGGE